MKSSIIIAVIIIASVTIIFGILFSSDVSESIVSLNKNVEMLSSGEINLSYSDGKPDTTNLDDINKVLYLIGVRVSTLPLPEKALPLLKTSQTRSLNSDETTELI